MSLLFCAIILTGLTTVELFVSSVLKTESASNLCFSYCSSTYNKFQRLSKKRNYYKKLI